MYIDNESRIESISVAGRNTNAARIEAHMHKYFRWVIRISAAVLLVICVGCGGTNDNSTSKGGASSTAHLRIGVSLLTRTHPFYQDLEAGLLEAAKANGFDLLITAGEFDVAKQKDQLQDFIVQRVNAIIVCPCDSRSIGTAIQAANDAGIPVFTADIACLAENAKIVSHVASDNVAGGRLAAKAVIEALGGHGKVAIIDHPEVESVIQRVRGFEEEISTVPGIQIVAKLSGHGVKDQAFRTAEDVIQAHPDIAAFFGINDDSALGALAAVEKAGKLGRVTIVGFDAVPEAREAIKAGKIYADVIQKPHEIGKKTIDAIKSYVSGSQLQSSILIPCGLFTHADAN